MRLKLTSFCCLEISQTIFKKKQVFVTVNVEIFFFLVLLHLVTPVKSQCRTNTDRFRRYSVPENMSVTDQMTGESIFTEVVGICLLKCKEDQKCLGMVYDIQNKRCFMKQCVNPHLFTEWNERDETFYIFISLRADRSLNKLLARGKVASPLWFVLKRNHMLIHISDSS